MGAVRSSFTELVQALEADSGTERVRRALNNLCDALITGAGTGQLSPEFLVRISKIKAPDSTTRLFEEYGMLPGIASAICGAVERRIATGGAVSLTTLRQLKSFAASPDLVGVEGSVQAYEALVAGLTSFYQETSSFEEKGFPTKPADLLAELMTALHRNAPKQPTGIAGVVQKLGAIRVAPQLLESLDSLLVNTAHPDRAIPAQVREAAIYAIAERIKRPPLRYQCAEEPGWIDNGKAFTLFKDICERCDQEIAIEAAVKNIAPILRTAADAMLRSPDALARSPFVEREAPSPSAELRGMIRSIRNSPIHDAVSRLHNPLADALKEADRLSYGIATQRASDILASLAPSSWREKIQSSLHGVFRGLDRILH